MRCRSCQHELWNVRPGPCPECGEPFNPRTAVFERYSAHFCCPHCSEAYWGNGQDGLPDPPEFTCARCAQPVRLEEMVLRSAPGQEGREVQQDLHPFEGSPKGFLRRCWQTASMSVSEPVRLGRALPRAPRLDQAFLFAGSVVGFGLASAALPLIIWIAYALITVGSIDVIGATAREDMPMVLGAGAGIGLIAPLVLMVAAAFLVWGVLVVTRKAAGQGRRLMACACYASGIGLLGVVPCVGVCAGPIVLLVGVRTMLEQMRGAGIVSERQAKVAFGLFGVLVLFPLGFFIWSATFGG